MVVVRQKVFSISLYLLVLKSDAEQPLQVQPPNSGVSEELTLISHQ